MSKFHQQNTIRYYLLAVIFLVFLFFSNDFGLIDVQKTAIVMGVGIDREDETFILTAQIAIPQASQQNKSTETVQIVSRGETIADAFESINAKTGWYPKLVFCHLILLGKKTAEQDVFDALDYFLRDEYLSDNCLLAVCDGFAKDMLNVTPLVDPSVSVAVRKVLSPHAQGVGTVLPSTLREFSIGYFSESKSGFLPLLKREPQQESVGKTTGEGNQQSGQKEEAQTTASENSGGQGKSGEAGAGQSGSAEKKEDKPVFSARETALFVGGKWVDTLTEQETFAFGAVNNPLRLAPYSVEQGEEVCTLSIRRNQPKVSLTLGVDKRVFLEISVTLTAGVVDYSKSLPLEKTADVGEVPGNIFPLAEQKLGAEIQSVFEKCRKNKCDLFGVLERLQKYEKKSFPAVADTALDGAIAKVNVRFRGVR